MTSAESEQALTRAWSALEAQPEDGSAKRLIARLLHRQPELISRDRKGALERLLVDPDVDPNELALAGWHLVRCDASWHPADEPRAIAASLEHEPLALLLLRQALVTSLETELALSQVRRWLLLTGSWPDYPQLAEALVAQAAINGGAWQLDEDERNMLADSTAGSFGQAFLPGSPVFKAKQALADPVTRAVAGQYARWPYPIWSRITRPEPTTLWSHVERLDGGRPNDLPKQAQILIAGCGTGREVAIAARRFPDARVTAIDLSSRSLAYAAERCRELGIDFHQLDLHDVGKLGQTFDFIACSGVLHHLPVPEAGWARLTEVLNPGGVMKIMVYSRLARLRIEAAKRQIADILAQPVDDDLLRAARRRLIDQCPDLVAGYADFYSIGGTHDLLFNAREDCFDVPRIAGDLDRLGLQLLGFKLPSAKDRNDYLTEYPHDPLFRDVRAWGQFEQGRPFLFESMYEFWCRKTG